MFMDRASLIDQKDPIHSSENIKLQDGVNIALRSLRAMGFRFALLTNQPWVSVGDMIQEQVTEVNECISDLLAEQGIRLHEIRTCFHAPKEDCNCRKPKTGMVDDISFHKELSCVICTMKSDIQFAENIGLQPIRLPKGDIDEKEVDVSSLRDAVLYIRSSLSEELYKAFLIEEAEKGIGMFHAPGM